MERVRVGAIRPPRRWWYGFGQALDTRREACDNAGHRETDGHAPGAALWVYPPTRGSEGTVIRDTELPGGLGGCNAVDGAAASGRGRTASTAGVSAAAVGLFGLPNAPASRACVLGAMRCGRQTASGRYAGQCAGQPSWDGLRGGVLLLRCCRRRCCCSCGPPRPRAFCCRPCSAPLVFSARRRWRPPGSVGNRHQERGKRWPHLGLSTRALNLRGPARAWDKQRPASASGIRHGTGQRHSPGQPGSLKPTAPQTHT